MNSSPDSACGKISVIVPSFDGARFLSSAVASILLQEWPELEIIVVDDGSTDNLATEIARLTTPVVYLQQTHKGPAAARNHGLRHATCDLIAFLDVDDVWTAGHLDRMYDALASHPEAGIAQGLMRQVSEYPDGRTLISGSYKMPHLGTCLFRRQVLDTMGGFDEGILIGEDYDLMFRCWEQGVVKVDIAEDSLMYRRHAGNVTLGKRQHGYLSVVQRRIQRIRSGKVDPTAVRATSFIDYSGNVDRFWKDQVETVGTWKI